MEEIVWDECLNNYILDLDKENTIKKQNIIKIPFHRRSERCEYCGSKILLVNKARHSRSKKHIDGQYITTEMFEIN